MRAYRAVNELRYDSGDLDRVIEWFAPGRSQSPFTGSVVSTMVSQGADRAHRKYRDVSEGVDGQSVVAATMDQWIVRYRGDVRAGWELEYDGRRYRVDGVPQEIGRKQWMSVMTKAVE